MLLYSILSSLATLTFGARILGIVPTPSYSHQIAFHFLWRELSLRGHQVTLITTDPINDPLLKNLTEINLHSTAYGLRNEFNAVDFAKKGFLEATERVLSFGNILIDLELQQPIVQALIRNETEHFDLLMVEVLYPAMYAFSSRYKCPLIGLASLDVPDHIYDAFGNPVHPVLNPSLMLPFIGQLTFFERLISTFCSLFMTYYNKKLTYPRHQELVNKHFGHEYPHIEDIFRNASMLFTMMDPIFHQIRPLVPAVISIGGPTHLKQPKPLPKELQKYLDNANHGFIYFSLGSNVKSTELSERTRQILLETFAELPYKIVWKFESEDLPGKPNNVFISKWFPQQDILRHPNIKLFITQGGLQSLEEAVYNHVPLVGMPFLRDQTTNIKKAVAKGFGLSVDHANLDTAILKQTILEVINNSKYRNKVREIAETAKDEPTTDLERAVWWTEYVLRHKGAAHLRSPAIDLPMYQYFLVDVIGFCCLVMLALIFLLVTIIRLICKIPAYFTAKLKQKMQ